MTDKFLYTKYWTLHCQNAHTNEGRLFFNRFTPQGYASEQHTSIQTSFPSKWAENYWNHPSYFVETNIELFIIRARIQIIRPVVQSVWLQNHGKSFFSSLWGGYAVCKIIIYCSNQKPSSVLNLLSGRILTRFKVFGMNICASKEGTYWCISLRFTLLLYRTYEIYSNWTIRTKIYCSCHAT